MLHYIIEYSIRRLTRLTPYALPNNMTHAPKVYRVWDLIQWCIALYHTSDTLHTSGSLHRCVGCWDCNRCDMYGIPHTDSDTQHKCVPTKKKVCCHSEIRAAVTLQDTKWQDCRQSEGPSFPHSCYPSKIICTRTCIIYLNVISSFFFVINVYNYCVCTWMQKYMYVYILYRWCGHINDIYDMVIWVCSRTGFI